MVSLSSGGMWQLRSCSILSRLSAAPGSCLKKQWGLQAAGDTGQEWRSLGPFDILVDEEFLPVSSLKGRTSGAETARVRTEVYCVFGQVDMVFFPTHAGNGWFLEVPVKTVASRRVWKRVSFRELPLKLELLKQDGNIPSFKSSVSGHFSQWPEKTGDFWESTKSKLETGLEEKESDDGTFTSSVSVLVF